MHERDQTGVARDESAGTSDDLAAAIDGFQRSKRKPGGGNYQANAVRVLREFAAWARERASPPPKTSTSATSGGTPDG